jgi:ankyrin repeat protein
MASADEQSSESNSKKQKIENSISSSFSNHFSEQPTSQVAFEAKSERHRATLMATFLNEDPLAIPDLLLSPHSPSDLDVNIMIDDQGHSALHWAAALGRMDILRLLLGKGGDVHKVNYHQESALMRSVMVTNNFDAQSFPELLTLLAPSLYLLDSNKRSVLHHISLVIIFAIL